MWKCPKCGRMFQKKKQSHSCKVYPLRNHFNGKEGVKPLYEELVTQIKKKIGPFRVDSVQCCVHFVKRYVFAGVFIHKDKIKLSFMSNKEIKNARIVKSLQVSKNRFAYEVVIKTKKEINIELIKWLKQAYNLSVLTNE